MEKEEFHLKLRHGHLGMPSLLLVTSSEKVLVNYLMDYTEDYVPKTSKHDVSMPELLRLLSNLSKDELNTILYPKKLLLLELEYDYIQSRLKFPSNVCMDRFIKLGLLLKRLENVKPPPSAARILGMVHRRRWRIDSFKHSLRPANRVPGDFVCMDQL